MSLLCYLLSHLLWLCSRLGGLAPEVEIDSCGFVKTFSERRPSRVFIDRSARFLLLSCRRAPQEV